MDDASVAGARPAPERPLQRLRQLLPQGRSLPEELWWGRHRGILILLWIHAVAIPVFARVRGFSPTHIVLEGLIVPVAAIVATPGILSRRVRTAAASLGLLSASAVLVHLSGGLIEMHFHFFVMVAVVALYQDWVPFLAAIGYVFIHHGVLGAIDPASVYNHPAAWNNPWKWAAIHMFFITGISLACLVTWRLDEYMLEQRRRAEERLREESRVAETLHEVGSALAAELDIERVVHTVTDAATQHTGARYGAFFYNVVDETREKYMLYTLSGASKEAFERLGLPGNTDVFRPTFEGREVVRLDDVTLDPRYGRSAPHHGMPAGHLPVRSYLAVPVRSRTGAVIGGLFFGHPEVAVFTAVDERIVVGIAAQAAVAIDNARLYESERRSRLASESAQRRLSLLAEVSRALTSSLEVDAILRGVADLIARDLADCCLIDLVRDDGSLSRSASVAPASRSLARRIDEVAPAHADRTHPINRVVEASRPEFHDPIPSGLLGTREGRRPGDPAGTAIIVPLPGRRSVLGALTVVTEGGSPRRLAKDDVPLIEELARRVSIAVENALLYARQRTVAETLQHSLLPERLPVVPGLTTAARYIPGGPGVEIGGDWYDVIQLPGGGIGLTMGDVVGRGERAASLMGQLRNALRAYSLEGKGPAEMVGSLNDLLNDLGREHMATMVYAVVEPDTGTLRLVNAGHPPPLVIGADGQRGFLDGGNGLPVGAVAGTSYRELVTTLQPGSTLLLYTDGLVEDRSTPLEVGMNRVLSAADGSAELEELCDHILERTLRGRENQDDVALLAMRMVPLGPTLRLELPTQPNVLAPLRAIMRRWLRSVGANETETYEIVLAAGEACANAIQHPLGPVPSTFEIECEADDDVRVRVRDSGRWRMPRPSGGGRGLHIMQSFMDAVEVIKHPDGTEVRMRRRISSRKPDGAMR